MHDDIIKKVFETAYVQVQSEVSDLEKTIRQKYDRQKEREQAITDLSAYTVELIRMILANAASLDDSKKAPALEAGLNGLIAKLKEVTQSSRDETLRLTGATNALSSVTEIVSKGYSLHSQELEKARAIQEKQESGSLDQKRKLGSRPDKLKDVRNYASDDKKE